MAYDTAGGDSASTISGGELFYSQTETGFTLAPGANLTLRFASPQLLNGTIYIENTTTISSVDSITLNLHEFFSAVATKLTLTQNRYGVYFDNEPIDYIYFKNNSLLNSIQIYYNIVLKQWMTPFNSLMQFLTQLATASQPNSAQQWYGTNQRYSGPLSGATFLVDVPDDTVMAIRAVSGQNTSTTNVGAVQINYANDLSFFADLAPLGVFNNTNTYVFLTDGITNLLPSSASTTNATINNIIIDYLFGFNMSIQFSGYSISVVGNTTTITFSGTVLAYFFTDQSDGISNALISSITNTNIDNTLSPTHGTADSSGHLAFTLTQTLNSTSNLPDTVSSSTTIAGVTASVGPVSNPTFGYNITCSSNLAPINQFGTLSVVVSSNTILSSDLFCLSFTINSGVTVTSNGFNIYCSGAFVNQGTISTGVASQSSYPNSFGSSGGGQASGCNNGANGQTPPNPSSSLTNSIIQLWYRNGMNTYLAGAQGGGGPLGTNGILIQADSIDNSGGTIISSNLQEPGHTFCGFGCFGAGVNGYSTSYPGGGGGGRCGASAAVNEGNGAGGVGCIALVYNTLISSGTTLLAGHVGGSDETTGGRSTNGNLIEYQYTTEPIPTGVTATLLTNQSISEPIANQTVSFSVTSGTATLSNSSGTTDITGTAYTHISSITGTAIIESLVTVATITNQSSTTIQ